MNDIFCHSCPLKRGQCVKTQFSSWNVPSLISRNRSHLAAPSGQGSENLRPLILDGARHPTQKVLSPQAVQVRRPVLRDWGPSRLPLLVGCRDRDVGVVNRSSRPGPRLLESLREGSGALQDFFPVYYLGSPAHPLTQGWMISRSSKRMPESSSSLMFQLMTNTPPFLNHFSKTPFLTVTGGQGPMWCWSIAEQDNEWSLIDSWLLWMRPSEAPSKAELHLLPRNRMGWNEAHQWLTV